MSRKTPRYDLNRSNYTNQTLQIKIKSSVIKPARFTSKKATEASKTDVTGARIRKRSPSSTKIRKPLARGPPLDPKCLETFTHKFAETDANKKSSVGERSPNNLSTAHPPCKQVKQEHQAKHHIWRKKQ